MPQHSISPAGVEMRDPEEILIMRKNVDDHPDSGRMADEVSDFGISWWGNGYSRRNTWIICEQSFVIDLEESR